MHEQISQVEKSIIWALNLLIDHSKKKCAKWAHRNCSSIHKTWTGSSHMEVKVDTASTSNQEVTIIWYQAGKGKTSFSQWSVCKCFCSDGKVSWNSRHPRTRKHTALRCDSDSVPRKVYPETQELRKLKLWGCLLSRGLAAPRGGIPSWVEELRTTSCC